MNSKSHIIVKSQGKTYFGESTKEDNSLVPITLRNVVELVTTLGVTPGGGVQKKVLVTTIDYCSGALSSMDILDPSLVYTIGDMTAKDTMALMEDYERILNSDNLIQAPPKRNLVQ